VPDDRNSKNINKDYGLMGFRIPSVVVSPWVKRGHVEHTTYAFESILKMIEYRFGVGPLSSRDLYATNIARSFDWRSRPRLALPNLPHPAEVVSVACAASPSHSIGGNATDAPRPKEHDLMTLVTSGYLDRLGFKYRPATIEGTYREPSKVKQAFVPAT
jgi:phospholipase C